MKLLTSKKLFIFKWLTLDRQINRGFRPGTEKIKVKGKGEISSLSLLFLMDSSLVLDLCFPNFVYLP